MYLITGNIRYNTWLVLCEFVENTVLPTILVHSSLFYVIPPFLPRALYL